MSVITATDAKKSFFDLMDRVIQKHEVVRVRSEEGGAVLLSEEKFEGMQETLALLSSKGFREGFDRARSEVEKGQARSFEEVFGEPLRDAIDEFDGLTSKARKQARSAGMKQSDIKAAVKSARSP